MDQRKVYRVLVGCTGSVAAIKVPKLIEELFSMPLETEIKLIPTKNSQHFFDVGTISSPIHMDDDEWENWKTRDDPVLHIELRRWADLMVIAPLDANTLAKISNGICDNLLTCVVRAWDMTRPLLFAPAMNTFMWEHPLTAQQITKLKGFGYDEIPCISKKLACGDTGYGAMAEVSTIVAEVHQKLQQLQIDSSCNKT